VGIETGPAITTTQQPAPIRASRVRWGVMLFLCVLAFLTYFDRVCIASTKGAIERDLHLSEDDMGWILGGFWLAYGLLEIPGGWLGDRYGSRRTLSRIVLAWSIFTALTGSASGIISLYLYRFFFGAGEAGAFPNMARVQNAWFPTRAQGRVGGVLWLIARWGGGLSYLIFPSLLAAIDSPTARHLFATVPGLGFLSHTAAWRIGFWVCGLLGLTWVVSFYSWFRDDPAQKRSVNEAELALIRQDRPASQVAGHVPSGGRILLALMGSGSLWAIAGAYMCGSFCWSFFVSWMPEYMSNVQHADPNIAKWMNTGPLLVGGAACLLGGWLSDQLVRISGRPRLGRVLFPIVGYALFGASMFSLRYAQGPKTALVLMCLASFGNDIGQAAAWASIIGIGGLYAGTAFGFINTAANVIGNSLQPVVGPKVFHHYGWNTLFLIYTCVMATASMLWFLPNPTKRFYDEEDPSTGPLTAALSPRERGNLGMGEG